MPSALSRKMTLGDLRAARQSNTPMAMLTCYDFTMARHMQAAGVPAILVGDSAASVVLGHDSTLPVSLEFMIDITAAVRRGAPLAFLVADMPFGSYQASVEQGVLNVCRMIKQTGCDCVKLEAGPSHTTLIRALADAGVAVMAHLGLRPQSVSLLGGYKAQARTAVEAHQLVALGLQMEAAGAAAILLEAVPSDVAKAVVERTSVPIVGCGAGPDCHSSVIVTHDAIGLTPARPRFVPVLADVAATWIECFATYARNVANRTYPAPEHDYPMPDAEKAKFLQTSQTKPN